MGWFYGFKLHLIVNHVGELLAAKITPTNVKKNMKAKLLRAWDKAMLSKRFLIETINDQLKNITQIEHSRHRSLHGFMLNIIAGLIAYSPKENKPSLKLSTEEFNMMVAV